MHDVDELLLLSFLGGAPPQDFLDRMAAGAPGFTFFRGYNDVDGDGLLAINDAVWTAVGDGPAPIIAVDQEGGQLESAGAAATPFAGNMALAAVDDVGLTERVGAAMGTELRALGFTLNYAPDADLASNPGNPGAGIRTFGDDPERAGDHVAAIVRGFQSAGVAATLKHFPGKGDASVDTHHQLAIIDHTAEQLREEDSVSFRAGIAAGAAVVMSGHYALPSLTGRRDLPCTLATEAMTDFLRGELGFGGLAITDALDMGALNQEGLAQAMDLIAAVIAGNDLLLSTPVEGQIERVRSVLRLAADRRVLPPARVAEAKGRIAALRNWLSGFDRPDLSVVRSSANRELAVELARRATTKVRGADAPLAGAERVLVIEPRHEAVTPADTSAWAIEGGLAQALGKHVPVESIVVPTEPSADDVAAVVKAASEASSVLLATANAHFIEPQAAMANAVLGAAPAATTAALRVPWDVWAYPATTSHWSTYSIQQDSLDALAAALVGDFAATGTVPVSGVA